MNKKYQSLALVVLLASIGGCASNSNKSEENNVTIKYYSHLDKGVCMRELFPEFKAEKREIRAYGKLVDSYIDTTWLAPIYGGHSIFVRDSDPPYVPEGTIKTKDTKQYQFEWFTRSDSAAIVVFSPFELGNIEIRKRFGIGLFFRGPKGWYLKASDPDFHAQIPTGQQILYIRIIDSIDGKPALFTISETELKGRGTSNYPTRDIRLFDFNLNSWISRFPKEFEIKNPRDSFGEFGLFNFDELEKCIIAVGNNMSLLSSTFSCKVDSKGQVTYVKYLAKGPASVGYGSETVTVASGNPIAEGRLEEKIGKRKSQNAPYEDEYFFYRVHVGPWKNYLLDESYYFAGSIPIGDVPDAYAKGKLQDSTRVFTEGVAKLDARKMVIAEEQAEAASIRHQRDEYFDRMKAQQDQNRAVDEVIRKAGLCSYCSGRGCLQCGQTGRSQR